MPDYQKDTPRQAALRREIETHAIWQYPPEERLQHNREWQSLYLLVFEFKNFLQKIEHRLQNTDASALTQDEEAMLENPNLNQSPGFGVPYSTKADILVSDGDELKVGDVTLKFIHTPGHTEGGMCIYVKEAKALFSGDTLFRQSIGRTDFPGGSYKEIMDSIRKKLFLLPDDTNVFPGHMGMTSIGFEKENNPFV